MTASMPPPDDDLPRDPAFDESWRALSAEEPPAAIDAALRAAARREVDAGPRIAVADRIATAHAAKPMNWWRPLAVAATLGAIAVGLVQLVTPDKIGAPGHDAVVSDMPPSTTAGRAESTKQQAAEAMPGAGSTEEKTRMQESVAVPPSADRKDALPSPPRETAQPASISAQREMPSRGAANVPPQAAPLDEGARGSAAPRKRDTEAGVARDKVEAPSGAPASAPVVASPAPPASSVAPSRAAEPFPADRGDASSKREAARESAPAGTLAQSPMEGAADKPVAPQPTTDNRAAPLAKLKAAPAASEGAAAATDSASTLRAQEARAVPPAAPSMTMRSAVPAPSAYAQGGAHPPLAVPDWIALIRRLIAESNFIAANRELAAFRATHTDAQQLLPPDLRDWKAPR
jgi:hypothetical protein